MLSKFYIPKLLSSFISQLTSLLLVYFLSAEDYGYLGLLISFAQLLYVVTCGWTCGALLNLGTKAFALTGNYLDIVAYRAIIVAPIAIGIGALLLLLRHKVDFYFEAEGSTLLVFGLFSAYVLYDFGTQLLNPGKRTWMQSIIELCANLIINGVVINLAITIPRYVSTFVIVSGILFAVVVVLFLRDNRATMLGLNCKDFVSLLHYSLWQSVGIVGIYAVNHGMNYAFYLNNVGYAEMGGYNFAYRLFMGFSPIFALFGVIIPKWMHGKTYPKFAASPYPVILSIISAICGLYLILALSIDPILHLIGKRGYPDTGRYLLLLFPAFALIAYTSLLNIVFANSSFYKSVQYAILLQGAVIGSISYLLIRFFYIAGAILSVTCAQALTAYYMYLLFRKHKSEIFFPVQAVTVT